MIQSLSVPQTQRHQRENSTTSTSEKAPNAPRRSAINPTLLTRTSCVSDGLEPRTSPNNSCSEATTKTKRQIYRGHFRRGLPAALLALCPSAGRGFPWSNGTGEESQTRRPKRCIPPAADRGETRASLLRLTGERNLGYSHDSCKAHRKQCIEQL